MSHLSPDSNTYRFGAALYYYCGAITGKLRPDMELQH